MHRNLSVKRHRNSHNARDKESYLIPISDFKDGGLWVQLRAGEEFNEDEVVMLDGERGRVESFQSEEGNRRTISFNSRMWHATRPWSGDRQVLAVYNVRGLTKLNEEIVEALGFQLPQDLVSSQVPRIRKLLGNEGGETQEPQQMEAELELVETVMHIRMTEEEWISTGARYGVDHYIAEMAARWRYINPQDGDLNSVIPAAIVADLGRDWVQHPRIFLVNDDGEELRVGRMMAMTTTRAPSFDPEGMTANWIKACKVYNEVLNIEEMVFGFIVGRWLDLLSLMGLAKTVESLLYQTWIFVEEYQGWP